MWEWEWELWSAHRTRVTLEQNRVTALKRTRTPADPPAFFTFHLCLFFLLLFLSSLPSLHLQQQMLIPSPSSLLWYTQIYPHTPVWGCLQTRLHFCFPFISSSSRTEKGNVTVPHVLVSKQVCVIWEVKWSQFLKAYFLRDPATNDFCSISRDGPGDWKLETDSPPVESVCVRHRFCLAFTNITTTIQ